MNLELSICLIYIVISSNAHQCYLVVRLKQNLLNDGFHRNLTYSIVFSANEDIAEFENWLPNNCRVGLEQELPAGVYADPEELNSLRRIGKVNAAVSSRVNIEQSAEEASSSHVYVVGSVSEDEAGLWLPLHTRYQDAHKDFLDVAVNIIPQPKLYLQCPDSRLDSCDLLTPERIPVLCTTKHKCKWKDVPFTLMSDPVRWDVPIGNLTHTVVVVMGTFILVIVGTLQLLRAIHKFNRTINSKKV